MIGDPDLYCEPSKRYSERADKANLKLDIQTDFIDSFLAMVTRLFYPNKPIIPIVLFTADK
jgi:hypothetical protein